MHIKILVLGITGSVAKLKVLPGVAEFANLVSKQGITVEVIGYSRSKPNEAEINQLLPTSNTSFYQGTYEDIQIYQTLIATLTSNQRLWVYVALPPSVYPEILHQSKHLPENVTICFEKPFAVGGREFEDMYSYILDNNLYNNVVFVDHYALKSAALFTPANCINLKDIISIKSVAYETVGVEDRLGYYATIGAVKDMLVHLITLTQLQLSALTRKSVTILTIKLTHAHLGVYSSIENQLPPNIPTFFDLQGVAEIENESTIKIRFCSGKKLSAKLTETSIETSQGLVVWQLAPQAFYDTGASTVDLSQSPLDHTNLWFDLLSGEKKLVYNLYQARAVVTLETQIISELERINVSKKSIVYPDAISIDQLRLLNQ